MQATAIDNTASETSRLMAAATPARSSRQRDAARDAAESFVATALIQPILKQLRQTNNAAAPFAPGAFEKQFAPLMDQIWSEQMVRANNWPLIDTLAQRLREQTGVKPGSTEKADGNTAGKAKREVIDFRSPRPPENSARSVLSSRGWLG